MKQTEPDQITTFLKKTTYEWLISGAGLTPREAIVLLLHRVCGCTFAEMSTMFTGRGSLTRMTAGGLRAVEKKAISKLPALILVSAPL
jgi:hypothetical protein